MNKFSHELTSFMLCMLGNLCTTLLPNLIINTKSILFLAFAEKSVDPDQLASEKPADLGLHCF